MAQYKIEVRGAEEFERLREKAEETAKRFADDMKELSDVIGNLRLSGVLDIGERRTERPRWNSVDAGLPPEGEAVIVYWVTTCGNLKSGAGYNNGGVWNVFGSNVKLVEGWMNIPAPPENAQRPGA